jgi:hypothetical protein
MVKISYVAKMKCRPLADFGGTENEFFEKVEAEMEKDEEIVVSIEGKEGTGMANMAVELTAFEKYYGHRPEQIVLTKEEEKKWQTKSRE